MLEEKVVIKKKIAQDKIDEAISIILNLSIENSHQELYNELVLISLSYHRLKTNYKTSMISMEHFNVELLKIAKRLLEFIDTLPP